MFPGVIFRRPSSLKDSGDVFITFDDGPIPEATPTVLDILDRFNVKATFFMVGQNIEKHPQIKEDVVKRGHRIANHSMHHIRGLKISPEDYLRDVEICEAFTGSKIYRPPHGWLTPRQLKILKDNGYCVVMYDLITRDYSKRLKSRNVVDNVKRYARDGSIIVFHDSKKSIDKLTTALPESLQWLKDKGFRFKLL